MHATKAPAANRKLPWRWLGRLLAAAVLAAVFLAYLRPELALDLAGRLWSCF